MPTLKQTVDSAIDPWAVQEKISTSDARYALASTLMPKNDSSYIEYRSGVMASGDGADTYLAGKVSPAGGMNVSVSPANVVINTENSGPYMGAIDSQKTLTLAPASSSTNRIDVVIARIYDDLNPALGGTSGVRKLSVELWTGDEVIGTPTPPTLPPAAGWHPLAYIQVNANTATITNAMIADKRGPGLVTRGGSRGLYGADSVPGSAEFEANGAYPGDQRWVHNAGFQHQVYYGSEMGWRGVHNAMSLYANPPSGSGIVWNKTIGQTVEICSVTVPDLGTPYQIYPSARIESWFGQSTRADFYITVHGPNGPKVSWVTGDCRWNNVNVDRHFTVNIAPIMWGNLSGSTTVSLTGVLFDQENSTFGWGLDRRKNLSTLLNVVVHPSTVQPDGSGGWDSSRQPS